MNRSFPSRLPVLFALLVGSSTIASAASASEPPAEDRAQADAFFREGRALMAAGKTAEACGKFSESQRLDPAPGTLVNLALCHEKDGKTASAWAEFNEVAERPGDDKARGTFAKAQAAALEQRLSRIRLIVSAADSRQVITIDGREKGSSAWDSALPLDPGDRVVEARAPGRRTWSQTVHLAAGPTVVDVRIPELAIDSVAAPATSPSPSPALSEPRAEGSDGGTSSVRIASYVLLGVGVVGVGVGSYFGIRTFGKKSDADALCPNNKCAGNADVKALDDDARQSALTSTIAIGVGALAAAGGIVLLVAQPKQTRASVSLRTLNVAHGAGVAIGGTL